MTVSLLPARRKDITANLAAFSRRAIGAFAVNTQRALKADTAQFATWCAAHKRRSLPATVETVEAFIQAMAALKQPATVRRYVSSIAKMHNAAAVPSPVSEAVTGKYHQPIQLALRTMHRSRGRRQRQVHGMTFDIRSRLLERIDVSTPKGVRDRALIMVAYDTALRRSELVALDVEDLHTGKDQLATLLLRKSKTDQEGHGVQVLVAPDTLEALKAWIKAIGDPRKGALFHAIRKGGSIQGRLTDQSVRLILKERAIQSGLPMEIAEKLSGHSPRVGLAQDMVANGLDLPAIMQAGRWKSPQMVSRYTEHLQARKGGAARLFALQHRILSA
jgi:site-specific recombinase XerD